jgi:flavin-dependent dehydrogenase
MMARVGVQELFAEQASSIAPADPGKASVSISGAGPAGLAAAMTLARAGVPAVVREFRNDVGARFHGDFQGIENWTTPGDVLEELADLGLETRVELFPCREATFYDPAGRETVLRSEKPLFYLVRRGPGPGTLDSGMKSAALECGVELRFGEKGEEPCRGAAIRAHGPQGCGAVAVGYVFETGMPDGIFGVLSNRIAPKGYAYLLVNRGRGTIAACLFDRFAEEKRYLDRALDFFDRRVGLRMENPRRFGGAGQFSLTRSACRGGVLLAGEAAGFQDALWGFGIRYALLSGHLAAQALLSGANYDLLWKRRFGGLQRASFVNRYFFARMGHPGYRWLIHALHRAPDPREWLRGFYAPSSWKSFWAPAAARLDGWTR